MKPINCFASANQAASDQKPRTCTGNPCAIPENHRPGNVENGKLYYNIGNIYFKTKDIGRFILNYKKAEQYIGNDINYAKNLAFAADATGQD
ncbi:MAG: hypothetical protein R2860_12620 [Desulfobacterales bacterium]